MLKTIKKEIPSHIEEYNIYICDICGKESRFTNIDKMQKLEVEDKKSSYAYPECGYTKSFIYDFCEDCTRDKIMPLIQKEFGKKPRIEEVDW